VPGANANEAAASLLVNTAETRVKLLQRGDRLQGLQGFAKKSAVRWQRTAKHHAARARRENSIGAGEHFAEAVLPQQFT